MVGKTTLKVLVLFVGLMFAVLGLFVLGLLQFDANQKLVVGLVAVAMAGVFLWSLAK